MTQELNTVKVNFTVDHVEIDEWARRIFAKRGKVVSIDYERFAKDGCITATVEVEKPKTKAAAEEIKQEFQARSRKKVGKEPAFKIDDIIIVQGVNKKGKEITQRFGCVFKISHGGTEDCWISPRQAKEQGRFAGTETKQKVIRAQQFRLQKDSQSTLRSFKVVAVCKFPKEFDWKEYEKLLANHGIPIAMLKGEM